MGEGGRTCVEVSARFNNTYNKHKKLEDAEQTDYNVRWKVYLQYLVFVFCKTDEVKKGYVFTLRKCIFQIM